MNVLPRLSLVLSNRRKPPTALGRLNRGLWPPSTSPLCPPPAGPRAGDLWPSHVTVAPHALVALQASPGQQTCGLRAGTLLVQA